MLKLIVFKYESALGNASAQQLFEMVTNPSMKDPEKPARAFTDYSDIEVVGDLPNGVSVL